MSTFTEYQNITYVTEKCCRCGVFFAMESQFHQQRRDHGAQFYCPNGHNQMYSKSRISELEEQLAEKSRQLTTSKCETLSERNARLSAETALAAEQLRREIAQRKLRRVKNGVCPCCKRSFHNLREHMKTKHPDALKGQ